MSLVDNASFNMQKQQLATANLTNDLLGQLVTEMRHANELTRWTIEHIHTNPTTRKVAS